MARPLFPLLCAAAAALPLLRAAADTDIHCSILLIHPIPAIRRSIPAVFGVIPIGIWELPAARIMEKPFPPHHRDPARCSLPQAVANAHIDAGNRTELNSRLRYSCNPGYKRKAGTSSLIQCVLWNGSQPQWTLPTLQCILSVKAVASSVGFLLVLATGIVAVCCWRRRKNSRGGYTVTETGIPMEALPRRNEEVAPPVIVPTG
ncbi:hypothetical protein HGM15179_016106 [Zosterops borbonicus]|uniref:Sushi domain-containing protein n=1 Tax=Zosterops borbonicus TaxID=364589 RepID=A0A8K1G3F1_9PASS|nr:hypothetical protein HGM15179_016106 [Zosterops borbonicus]